VNSPQSKPSSVFTTVNNVLISQSKPNLALAISDSPILQEYLNFLRSDDTKQCYAYSIKRIGDPDSLLQLAKNEPKQIEQLLIKFILKERDRASPTNVIIPITAIKGFLSYYDVLLNWGKITAALPRGKHIANDRAPTRKEIRLALEFSDARMRMVILILSSSGIRVGAFTDLKLKHLVNLENGCARLKIDAGVQEEYWALISPEARESIELYLEMRRQIGEKLTPESPLVRDKWNYDRRPFALDPAKATPVHSDTIANIIGTIWKRAGVVQEEKGNFGSRKEFKRAHGFRKFFRTHASRVMRPDDVEVLMGHQLNYYKPPIEYLEEEYGKAVSVLTISEVEEVKREAQMSQTALEKRLDQLSDVVSQLLAKKGEQILAEDPSRTPYTSPS